MIYCFQDKKSGFEIEVNRKYADRDEVPTDEELPEEERGKERDWERVLSGGIIVTRAPGYGTKGNW